MNNEISKVVKYEETRMSLQSQIISPYSPVDVNTDYIKDIYMDFLRRKKTIPRLSYLIDSAGKYNWDKFAEIAEYEYDNRLTLLLPEIATGIRESHYCEDSCPIEDKTEYIMYRANKLWAEANFSYDLFRLGESILDILIDLKYSVIIDTDTYDIATYARNSVGKEIIYANDCQRVIFNDFHRGTLGPLVNELSCYHDNSVIDGIFVRKL